MPVKCLDGQATTRSQCRSVAVDRPASRTEPGPTPATLPPQIICSVAVVCAAAASFHSSRSASVPQAHPRRASGLAQARPRRALGVPPARPRTPPGAPQDLALWGQDCPRIRPGIAQESSRNPPGLPQTPRTTKALQSTVLSGGVLHGHLRSKVASVSHETAEHATASRSRCARRPSRREGPTAPDRPACATRTRPAKAGHQRPKAPHPRTGGPTRPGCARFSCCLEAEVSGGSVRYLETPGFGRREKRATKRRRHFGGTITSWTSLMLRPSNGGS
jgi:hypothetical protein